MAPCVAADLQPIFVGVGNHVVNVTGGEAALSAALESRVDAPAGGQMVHGWVGQYVKGFDVFRGYGETPGIIVPLEQQIFLGDFEVPLAKGHVVQPVLAEGLQFLAIIKGRVETIEVAEKLRTFPNIAFSQVFFDLENLRAVIVNALQQSLLVGDVPLDFRILCFQMADQLIVIAIGDHLGDLVDGEAELFVPNAVQEKIDIPGVVISVVVALILMGRDNAFFLVITKNISRNTQYASHIADGIPHGEINSTFVDFLFSINNYSEINLKINHKEIYKF